MFGIGVAELLVIFVVALLVLGPDQLPKVARTLAKFIGEFRSASEDLRLNIMSASNDVNIGKADKTDRKKIGELVRAEGAVSRDEAQPEVIDMIPAAQKSQQEGAKLDG